MGNVVVRCCALLLGVAAIWWSVAFVGGPYRETMEFRHAVACPAGTAPDATRNCLAREVGQVVDKYIWDSDYRLTIQRASEDTEDEDVSHALYKTAREGDPADLEIWRGEVVAVTVRGERAYVGPSFGAGLALILVPAWGGLGLLWWSAFGGGRVRWLFGWAGTRAFAWLLLGAVMLLPVGLIIGGGVPGWGLAVVVLGCLISAGVCVIFIRPSFTDWL